MKNNYIFGYGSLISQESRARTGISGTAIPVTVIGIERQWNVVAQNNFFTCVGAISNSERKCNGVIFPVNELELQKFDDRELPHGYIRNELSRESIVPLDFCILHNFPIWYYAVTNPEKPSQNFPIIQSYIDVILNGCLEYGEDFAKTFIETTDGWQNDWINDREKPRYSRHLENRLEREEKIDGILKNNLLYFSRRE
ncbi:gamma-glutamylcyclotransferase [Candidatus Pacearchaeota archaeon]|nr:gamma-glutamylcyclotransferase [Candidatus Pacearchaeota archaeon]